MEHFLLTGVLYTFNDCEVFWCQMIIKCVKRYDNKLFINHFVFFVLGYSYFWIFFISYFFYFILFYFQKPLLEHGEFYLLYLLINRFSLLFFHFVLLTILTFNTFFHLWTFLIFNNNWVQLVHSRIASNWLQLRENVDSNLSIDTYLLDSFQWNWSNLVNLR